MQTLFPFLRRNCQWCRKLLMYIDYSSNPFEYLLCTSTLRIRKNCTQLKETVIKIYPPFKWEVFFGKVNWKTWEVFRDKWQLNIFFFHFTEIFEIVKRVFNFRYFNSKSWAWHNRSNLKVNEVISIKVSIRLHLENETKRISLVILQ